MVQLRQKASEPISHASVYLVFVCRFLIDPLLLFSLTVSSLLFLFVSSLIFLIFGSVSALILGRLFRFPGPSLIVLTLLDMLLLSLLFFTIPTLLALALQ